MDTTGTMAGVDAVAAPLLAALWRASWQGALFVAVVWATCRLAGPRLPAGARCWLWRLAYVKLLLALCFGGGLALPLLPRAAPAVVAQASTPAAIDVPALTAAATPTEPAPIAPPASPRTAAAARAAFDVRAAAPSALLALYVAGVGVFLVRLARAGLRTRAVLRAAVRLDRPLAEQVAEDLAARLGLRRAPRLLASPAADTPFYSAGVVILPVGAGGTELSEGEMRLVLAHELAHARRRDLAWEWLGTAAQALFFFHPLVLVARREERLARESAADALALGLTGAHPADYGRLLVSLAAAPDAGLAGAVGVMEGGDALRRRLEALKRSPALQGRRLAVLTVAVGLTTTVALVPWRLAPVAAQVAPVGPAVPLAQPPVPPPPRDSKPRTTGSGRLFGRVLLPGGRLPARGVEVQLQRRQASERGDSISPLITKLTGAGGDYSFENLSPGAYMFVITPPKAARLPRLTSSWVRFGDGEQEGQEIDIPLVAGEPVRGRVQYTDTREPVAGVIVHAYPDRGAVPDDQVFFMVHSNATTDEQGRYTVYLPPGDAIVSATPVGPSGSMPQLIRRELRVTVRRGGGTAGVDISVARPALLAFTGPDGRPIEGAEVRLFPATPDAPGAYNIEGRSDAAGIFPLTQYQAGTFRAHKGDLMAAGTFSREPGEPLVVRTDAEVFSARDGRVKVPMSVEAPAYLVGRVQHENGTPIAGAVVRIAESDPKSRSLRGIRLFRSGADGRFRAPCPLGGEFSASARADGYNHLRLMSVESFRPRQRGDVADAGDVTLRQANGTVTGRVLDEAGQPAVGVVVEAQGRFTYQSAALTNTDGRFELRNLVPSEDLVVRIFRGELLQGDSGTAMQHSNDIWYRTGVRAGRTGLLIRLLKSDVDRRVPVTP